MTGYAKACLQQRACNGFNAMSSMIHYSTSNSTHPSLLVKGLHMLKIARQTYVEAGWYNTSGRVLLLVMTQLYSTCFSQDHSTQFLRYKGHSCHIPPRCRFYHSPQLSQHPIWQCWQVQSWTIGQFQAHKLHRCLDGASHPSHLWSKSTI